MSFWYDKEKEDISFSNDGKELHIYLDSDNNGAIYASVKVEDVRKSLEELDSSTNESK